jgi:hypothetical protein
MSTERRTNLIPRSEILDLGEYERNRDSIRAGAMRARTMRRLELGPNATVAFENRETVRYQIQEMLRAERIAKEAEVQHEIETYSDLLPTSDTLSATLMFEFPDEQTRAVHLRDLVGFEDHLRLEINGAGTSKAWFDRRQLDADRISAVQFVRFALDERQRRALESGATARLTSDHPKYACSVDLPEQTRRGILADLGTADG